MTSLFDWSEPRPAPGGRGLAALRDGSLVIPGRADSQGAKLFCFMSKDEGHVWAKLGEIAFDSDPSTDLGDGNITQLEGSRLVAVYRRNHLHQDPPTYRIESVESLDGGKTWGKASLVASSSPPDRAPSRGLWAPLAFVTHDGKLQCYYDDEAAPFDQGFRGHQWLTMKTWSRSKGAWVNPVTVARAKDPTVLSRDGMATVVQLGPGRLLCAFEGVQSQSPHAGCLRFVTSDDDGVTWSWKASDRPILYQPADRRFHAFSPTLIRLSEKGLGLIFCTNEDRPEPGVSGTPARELNLDIKMISSQDQGRTWPTQAEMVHHGRGQNYLPGLALLAKGPKGGRLFATYLDFHQGFQGRVGLASDP